MYTKKKLVIYLLKICLKFISLCEVFGVEFGLLVFLLVLYCFAIQLNFHQEAKQFFFQLPFLGVIFVVHTENRKLNCSLVFKNFEFQKVPSL